MIKFLIPYMEIMLPVSAIILLLLIVRPLFEKRYAARLRYYIWLIIALRLLIPFDFNIIDKKTQLVEFTVPDVIVYQQETEETTISSPEMTIPSTTENNKITGSNTVVLPDPTPVEPVTLTAAELGCILWLGGSVLILCWFLLQFAVSSREFRKNSVIDYSSQFILAKLREDLNIKINLLYISAVLLHRLLLSA